MMRPVLSREAYLALRGSKKQQAILKAVREGDERQKHRLIQMNYSCLPGADGRLKGCKTPSATVGMDIDHIPQGELAAVRERILSRQGELGLLMLELSARGEGYHLVFRRRPELSQEENLRWASNLLGVRFDDGAKDITRVFFTTTEEELLFLSDEIFALGEAAKAETLEAEAVMPKAETPEAEAVKAEPEEPEPEADLPKAEEPHPRTYPTEYHGIPFAEILKKYWEVNNRGFEPTKGDRDTLTYQLAADLRHICGKSFEWLDQVIPCYDGFAPDEKRQKIRNALASRYEGMPQRLKDTLAALEPQQPKTAEGHQGEVGEGLPPQMPAELPPLIGLLVSRTPELYKPAVSHAVFPSLATHLHGVRFRYIDNVEHEPTLMNVLMAGTGAGKDCISGPINHIMADIRRRDADNLAREKAWKDEVNRKGANKDKRQRPEGLVIQEIDADMTGPAFVMRMAEADGHFLYTKLNEIDQFDALRGNGRTGQQFQIMCLAFDPNNRYGQTRVGTQSVTEKVCIRFNWNASTTIQKGQRYFERVLTDGPVSRINFCTIPEREIGAEMPVYGTYDTQFDEALRPYIERLCAARGTIDCPQAYQLAVRLKDECADFARLSQSRTYENLSFRALVIAYLKACVLFVAHGYRWDATMEDFTRWSLHYDLWCKMRFFGEAIERANSGAQPAGRRGPRNLLELLPDEFTIDDAIRIRREQGLPREGVHDMIRTWRNRGYIGGRTNSSNSFLKLKFKSEDLLIP